MWSAEQVLIFGIFHVRHLTSQKNLSPEKQENILNVLQAKDDSEVDHILSLQSC